MSRVHTSTINANMSKGDGSDDEDAEMELDDNTGKQERMAPDIRR